MTFERTDGQRTGEPVSTHTPGHFVLWCLVVFGAMTVVTLVAFIANLNVLFTDVHTSLAAAETTFDFLDENFSIPDDGKAVVWPIKTHEFSDVCFAYSDEFGLQHVTFKIDPHQKQYCCNRRKWVR